MELLTNEGVGFFVDVFGTGGGLGVCFGFF